MAICPQCSDFLKPKATACPECGWNEEPPIRASREHSWSPSTPPFRDEPWRAEPRMSPDAVAPYLAALKAVVAVPSATGQPLDPAMTQRYLEACRARKVQGHDPIPF
jgi:hypothetical protein